MTKIEETIPAFEEDAATKLQKFTSTNREMHTFTSFRCDPKGMWVDVYIDADDCSGSPNTQALNKWGECQQTVNGAFFKVYVKAEPNIDDDKGKDEKDKKDKKKEKKDKPETHNSDDTGESGAFAIKAASVALLALIGSQF